jgi:signal transduction histidine kinase/uncharacterized membrane protein YidH (DUF202 family)
MGFYTFTALYLFAILGFFVIGLFSFTRRPSRVTGSFAVFCATIGLWQLVQLLAQILYTSHAVAVFFMQASAFLGAYVGIGFIHFTFTYTKRRVPIKPLLAVGTAVSLQSLLSPGLQNATVTQNGFHIGLDPFYIVVLLFGVLTAAVGTAVILRNYLQHSRGYHRHDALLVFGIVLSVVAIMAISAVSSSNFAVQIIAPLICLFAASLVSYALVFQGLFDLRIFSVRLLGYLLTVLALSTLYGLLISTLVRAVFKLDVDIWALMYLSMATGVLAMSFRHFKRLFDRTTNRIFYRDAYDSGELFDRLNRTLVSSLNIDYLLKRTAEIIDECIKVQFVFFELIDTATAGNGYRHLGDDAPASSKSVDLAKIGALATNVREQVILTDLLDKDHDKLRALLAAADIAALVRLSSDLRRGKDGLGFMALGAKKSGNSYTQQDVQTLENVAKELMLAIQNSLHFEETQQFNVVLQTRVDDATRKLRRSNEKLKALDETKDDFISMASHQLRTPLTSVKGYLSMVLEGDAGKISPSQRQMLTQAFISSQRMVYLIADLLNVSRLKTGKFIIDAAPTNLANLVAEEVSQLVETAASRDITLRYDKPSNFPLARLDETKTRQVVMNLIDNAIYYTPAGGHITVEAAHTDDEVTFRVTDDGIGVPESEQRHLFTKFYRAGNARKARPDGTGLGLFMAKKVVDAQGGSIIFSSREGKGSTFGFAIPLHGARLVPAAVHQPELAA